MTTPLNFRTVFLLTLPPLLWAGNAIVGRLVHAMVPPVLLNLLRWSIACLILLALAGPVFARGSALWRHWRRYSMLGLLGIGMFNALQYLALQSSTPINVTLVASSLPVWMMLSGRLFFGAPVSARQLAGAVLSIAGVLVVLARGEWGHVLGLRLVAGDLFMILASIAWSFYSWLLMRTTEPAALRADWAGFLLAQVGFGALWSGAFALGEQALGPIAVQWSWALVGALAYVAIFPAIIAFRCWGEGVRLAGPGVGAFFVNLTPLFTALLSAAILGETPHLYHGAAFVLIVAGIVVSARR
ncbi:DMT family transporter [Janthinobacterium psychrotolerans]|uniref:Threonine/homoserine efflux transporter RhtA n=1 Tax=Janthinobacterium psychrotolerans TaxID=1747903 RepID=A0A1A7C130_9BURK|nr:DMT family transporter [Janthinobacterium psychrotolerans]OBV38013.1 Threonine/homoserine efflux transporter RhtA [Janthinobacterium psychrotolerans]